MIACITQIYLVSKHMPGSEASIHIEYLPCVCRGKDHWRTSIDTADEYRATDFISHLFMFLCRVERLRLWRGFRQARRVATMVTSATADMSWDDDRFTRRNVSFLSTTVNISFELFHRDR